MSRTSYAVVAVAFVVVLAGCGGLVGGGGTATDAGDGDDAPATSGVDGSTDERNGTDQRSGTGDGDGTADSDAGGDADGTTGGAGTDAGSRTATVNASRPALSAVSFPPGTNADGITNLTALRAAHRSALADTGYVKRSEFVQRTDGSYRNVSYVQYSSVAAEAIRFRIHRERLAGGNWTNVTRKRYDVPETIYKTVVGEDGVTTDSPSWTFEKRHTRLGKRPADLLGRTEFAAVETVERDGHTYVRYRPTAVSFDGNTTVNSLRGTLLVREDGLIERFSLTVRADRGTLRLSQRYVRLGSVDVERPAWVNETA